MTDPHPQMGFTELSKDKGLETPVLPLKASTSSFEAPLILSVALEETVLPQTG